MSHSPCFRHTGENRYPEALKTWIPGRADYRQLARNDDFSSVANFGSWTVDVFKQEEQLP
jgi:hypothetical protein